VKERHGSKSSSTLCHLQFMSDHPPQDRSLGWAALLAVLVVLVFVLPFAGRAVLHYKEDVAAECAVQFEADKTNLVGYHWSWWWLPGWVCEYQRDGRRWERHLW
jgi:hypothetical protein